MINMQDHPPLQSPIEVDAEQIWKHIWDILDADIETYCGCSVCGLRPAVKNIALMYIEARINSEEKYLPYITPEHFEKLRKRLDYLTALKNEIENIII